MSSAKGGHRCEQRRLRKTTEGAHKAGGRRKRAGPHLAALGATDAVIIFDEATPFELIRHVRPDVLVKGGDYTTSTIVGAEDVVTWGGRVEIVPTVNGASTTSTIRKMTANQ